MSQRSAQIICVFPLPFKNSCVSKCMQIVAENASTERVDSSIFANAKILVLHVADTDPVQLVTDLNAENIGQFAMLQMPADRRFVQISNVLQTGSQKLGEMMRMLPSAACVSIVQGLWDVYLMRIGCARSSQAPPDRESRPKLGFKRDVQIDGIVNRVDTRTGVVWRNLPHRLDTDDLIELMRKHGVANFDYLYLPADHNRGCNLGHAFIRFFRATDIIPFFKAFHNFRWSTVVEGSEKIASIFYSREQALPGSLKPANLWNLVDHSGVPLRPECRGRIAPGDVWCAKRWRSQASPMPLPGQTCSNVQFEFDPPMQQSTASTTFEPHQAVGGGFPSMDQKQHEQDVY